MNMPLDITAMTAHLPTIYLADQGLLAARIFLAHAASLRHTTFFARVKFGGFLHSFILRVRILKAFTGLCKPRILRRSVQLGRRP